MLSHGIEAMNWRYDFSSLSKGMYTMPNFFGGNDLLPLTMLLYAFAIRGVTTRHRLSLRISVC